jgi:hypothetical protein
MVVGAMIPRDFFDAGVACLRAQPDADAARSTYPDSCKME